MRQLDHAIPILKPENLHIDLVAQLQFLLAVIFEFIDRHRAFALVADIDHDFLLTDLNDRPFDYLAGSKVSLTLRHGLFHGYRHFFM